MFLCVLERYANMLFDAFGRIEKKIIFREMGAEKLALAKKIDATLTSSYNKKRLQYDSRPSLKIE